MSRKDTTGAVSFCVKTMYCGFPLNHQQTIRNIAEQRPLNDMERGEQLIQERLGKNSQALNDY
ncbi:hypothetical protein P5673_009390 [Acropora cervicornis]|uniref:Uncharacterized protein n=1 Tax=Acropora cervicornis TaxID=6130 RepID=A0AAD9V9X6_ACRCE|nr:hypothetical protein P5673_009390 [Acropora cervicornis]